MQRENDLIVKGSINMPSINNSSFLVIWLKYYLLYLELWLFHDASAYYKIID